jgi:hypothetical protein
MSRKAHPHSLGKVLKVYYRACIIPDRQEQDASDLNVEKLYSVEPKVSCFTIYLEQDYKQRKQIVDKIDLDFANYHESYQRRCEGQIPSFHDVTKYMNEYRSYIDSQVQKSTLLTTKQAIFIQSW